jgi:hypothetical protein
MWLNIGIVLSKGMLMSDFYEKTIQPQEKLVDWSNPPKLADLKQDLEDATPYHNEVKGQVAKWHKNFNVEGDVKPKKKINGSSIVPRLIRKQAEWRYPALSDPFLSSPDIFNVKPVSWEDRKAAQQNALVLNNQFNTKIDKVHFIDEFVRALVDEGTAITRVGWEFEEEEYDAEVPDVEFLVDPAAAQLHQELEQMQQNSPAQYDLEVPDELKQAHELTKEKGVPIRPNVIGYKMEKKTRITKNQPTVEVCNINNVVFDPSCKGDIKKAKFAVYTFETSYAELKKAGRYKNLDSVQSNGSSPLNAPDHDSGSLGNFNFKDKPRQLFVVHEYWGFWDIHGNGVLVPIVAAWAGNVLIRLEENPFPDKAIPFVVARYMPKRRKIHGEPDGELLEENQKIIGAVTRGMIDILGKSANGQTGMRKDMLDAVNRRRFDNGQDYEFNANVDPRQGVHMHTYPEIPQSAQFMLQLQQFEAESMTGVKSFSSGIGSQSLGDVAAGIRGALDAASKRELSILRRASEAIVAIGRKILAMNQEFLSEQEVVRVTNEQFATIHKDDIQGRFDLELTISTAEEDNNKAQELAFMLQTMGNTMDPELSKMILSDIARLRKMPDLAKRIEEYTPQPDPLAVQKAQLEIQLLQAQIENERAQAQERASNAGLHGAKANTEAAKAENLQSDTDKKNLDFVEQESGVHQERQMQLAGAQAESQARLKMAEHGMQREKNQTDLLKTYIQAKAKSQAQTKVA